MVQRSARILCHLAETTHETGTTHERPDASQTQRPRNAGWRSRLGRRTLFRVFGVVLMGTALVLFGLAIADFFALGGLFLQLGFAGATARYMADEYSPAIQRVSQDLGLRGDEAATGRTTPTRGSVTAAVRR